MITRHGMFETTGYVRAGCACRQPGMQTAGPCHPSRGGGTSLHTREPVRRSETPSAGRRSVPHSQLLRGTHDILHPPLLRFQDERNVAAGPNLENLPHADPSPVALWSKVAAIHSVANYTNARNTRVRLCVAASGTSRHQAAILGCLTLRRVGQLPPIGFLPMSSVRRRQQAGVDLQGSRPEIGTRPRGNNRLGGRIPAKGGNTSRRLPAHAQNRSTARQAKASPAKPSSAKAPLALLLGLDYFTLLTSCPRHPSSITH